jgi:hypothetical protein
MRKNTFLTGTLVLVMAFILVLAGCDNDTTNGSQTTTPGTKPGPDPKALSPALRAVPTAASTASPVVLDSYTDGTKNYYLIDVGYVRNVYVSTILRGYFNGMTPVFLSKTTITTSTVTEALTQTISESITISNTQTGKVDVETAWKKKFPVVGEFSAKLNLEWTGSWTNSKTSSKSTETSVSKTESKMEECTTSITIGGHGEPEGYYRYALYTICDVYFIISTSPDNDRLLSWETAVCARDSESSYIDHMDYSADAIFDNSPDGKEITFAEDFYKNLPKPTSTEPPFNTSQTISTDFKTIRTNTVRITSGYIFDNPVDVVNFDVFGVNLNQLKQNGYMTVSFYFQLNIREIKNGNQYIFLYSSKKNSVEYLLSQLFVEHSPGKEDTNWWVHNENELKFENISLDKFVNNEFIIGYNADKYKGNSYGLDWENKDLKIQLVIKK